MKHFVVEEAGLRLDQYLSKKILAQTRSQIKRKIFEFVLLNSKKAKPSAILKVGDLIDILDPFYEEASIKPEGGELSILFEDNNILVINKPARLLTHPTPKHKTGTLVNFLLNHCKNLPTLQGEDRPGIVHRLDRNTSGVMVIAKTEEAQKSLISQFKDRKIKKTYLAVVFGIMDSLEGTLEYSLARNVRSRTKMSVSAEGREAITKWKVKEEFTELSLLEVMPRTGRTHQIRIHFQKVNHPIVGDRMYGDKNWLIKVRNPITKKVLGGARRQLLHSWQIGFKHPCTMEYVQFKAPLPADFKEVLNLLQSKCAKDL